METSPCCNSVTGHQIATNFCTCHDSTAVVPCTKFCSDHCIRIEMRVKRNFHRILIAMEKTVKRGLGGYLKLHSLQWRHVRIKASQITNNSTVQKFVHANNRRNINVPHYQPFVKGLIHRWQLAPQIARFMGPTWAHLGPVGPRWAPYWPHEPCCQGPLTNGQ